MGFSPVFLMFSADQFSRRITRSFALLLGLLLLLCGFSLVNFRRMADAQAWNQHSYQVLLESYQLADSLSRMDSGVRTFAVSGNPSALGDFETGLQAYDEHFASLKNLTSDRLAHQQRLERLNLRKKVLIEQFLRPIIAMRRETPDDTQAILKLRRVTLARRAALTAAQEPLDELESAEAAIQQARSARLQRSQIWTQTTLALGSLFSIGLTSGLIWLSIQGSRRLDEANAELLNARNRTEAANRELLCINARLEAEIAQRRAAEEKLSRGVEELKKSNAELEQFAYVASHDLQEPLRAVGGCVQVLQKRYAGKLDARADQLIQHAVDGAQRMQTLINDLLAYSRVGTKGKGFETVDGTRILAGALQSTSVSALESGAQICCDPMPILRCDAGQIEQVLQNLISNAIKFRGEAPPRIHVGCEREIDAAGHDSWLFSVRDDGPGIDPQYFDRIFVMFQRLHTRTQFPGTGIGLAICKKIVERHGGTLWVESQPGHGSNFRFRLPVEPPESPEELLAPDPFDAPAMPGETALEPLSPRRNAPEPHTVAI
jgi:signal transduction histidine kinase